MRAVNLDLPSGRHVASTWNTEAPGVPILALHGFTGSGADWAPVGESLNSRLLAPDVLGHGGSPAPEAPADYRIEEVVSHCHRWCDHHPDWIVVGYSMGGRVAMRLAPALGDRLRGLVLISTSPGIEDVEDRAARAARDGELADAIEANGVAWFTERWSNHPLIRSQEQIPRSIRTAMQERRLQNRATGLAGSLRGMGQGSVEPFWNHLGAIHAPTLWISGDHDPQYTTIAARGVARLPSARHVTIPGAGHCTHLEAPSPTLKLLGRFVTAASATGGFDWGAVQSDPASDS